MTRIKKTLTRAKYRIDIETEVWSSDNGEDFEMNEKEILKSIESAMPEGVDVTDITMTDRKDYAEEIIIADNEEETIWE